MKKIFLFAALAASLSLFAQTTTYTKVTTAPSDWTGTYLIVCEAQNVAFNGASDIDNIDAQNGLAVVAVTISDGTITGSEAIDAATFTIASTDSIDWPWSIQSASGLYIGHKDTVDNGLSTETELKNKCLHTLSIVDGDFIAVPRHIVNGAYQLQYNKKQQRFRYYVAGDKLNVQLYKLEGAATALVNTDLFAQAIKRYENGQIVIIKDGKKYNVLGKKL